MNAQSQPPDCSSDSFNTTQWSVVLAAGRVGKAKCQDALTTLCRTYWYPVYRYVRRRESNPESAQDLTQGFFVRLLEKDIVAKASPERGRFRAFLLTSIKNFLANEHDREAALKRGGNWQAWSLDWQNAESRLNLQPTNDLTPERLFERAWALDLLERVLQRLREEFVLAGKARQFDLLKVTLTTDRAADSYLAIASELKLSGEAVRQAAHRLRLRYRTLLRDEVAQTVADTAEIDEEIRSLFEVLGS